MSPWVATTRLSLVATMTLQPVPQKRQAALSHFRSVTSRSVTRFAASAGTGMPAAGAAIAAASSFRSWRRSSLVVMAFPQAVIALAGRGGVEHERSRVHMRQQRDGGERRSERARIGSIDHDDELALGIAAVHLAPRKRDDGSGDLVEILGTRLHQNAGDLALRRRHHAIGIDDPTGDQ